MKRLAIILLLGTNVFAAGAQSNELKSLINTLASAEHDSVRVNVYYTISRFYWNKNLDSALLMADSAIDLARRMRFEKGVALGFSSKGVAYHSAGKYADALDCHFQALRTFEKLGLEELTGNCYNNIGIVYAGIGDHSMALSYYQKSLAIVQKSTKPDAVFPLLVNIAELLAHENKFDEAIEYNKRALAISREVEDSLGTAITLFNMGDFYRKKGSYEKALDHLRQSLAISEEIDDKEGIAFSYNSMAEVYAARGRLNESVRYAKLGLAQSKKIGNVEIEKDAYGILCEGYRLMGNFEQALSYRNLEIALSDSLYTLDKEKAISKLQSTYELEKKQYQIDLLNKDKVIHQEELAREKFKRNTFIVGVIILSVLALFLVRTNSAKQKINNLLKNRNKEILQQKKEILMQNRRLEELNTIKNKLLSVISHDLRSPLHSLQGIINLMKSAALSEEEIDMLFEQVGKTLTLTTHLLDNLLYWARSQMEGAQVNPAYFELMEIVRENIRLMEGQAGYKKVSLVIDNAQEPVQTYADAAMIDIVIRNLLANAVKFSSVGDVVTVSVAQDNGHVRVTVKDEGRGIRPEHQARIFNRDISFTTPGTSDERGTGLGLLLCKELVEKNGGTIGFKSEFGKGSSFTFTIPGHAPAQ